MDLPEPLKALLRPVPADNPEGMTMGLVARAQDGRVIVELGAPVSYLALSPDQAEALAVTLNHMARRAREGS